MPNSSRLKDLQQFIRTALGRELAPVAASSDASFRSYWRIAEGAQSWIVMDAPPQHEDCRPFIDISARLLAAGLVAPRVLAQDLRLGFLLLDDLGTRTLLPELHADSVDTLYGRSLEALLRMQQRVQVDGLPRYDQSRLRVELELFPAWFLQRHLGWNASADAVGAGLIDAVSAHLLQAASEQPCCFVHRDFHSRNLMLPGDCAIGILDFQDAVLGPVTYDLVSLLKDCYIRWPAQQVQDWAEQYRQQLAAAGQEVPTPQHWQRWFDWMGLQRHLKVLGIFARLHYRDGKSGYLGDLPRVLDYVLETCARYPQLQAFGDWLQALAGEQELVYPRH